MKASGLPKRLERSLRQALETNPQSAQLVALQRSGVRDPRLQRRAATYLHGRRAAKRFGQASKLDARATNTRFLDAMATFQPVSAAAERQATHLESLAELERGAARSSVRSGMYSKRPLRRNTLAR